MKYNHKNEDIYRFCWLDSFFLKIFVKLRKLIKSN